MRPSISRRLGLATYAGAPHLTDDERHVIAPLARRRIDVVPFDWRTGVPAGVDAVVVRSCWDYHEHEAAFRAWIDALAATGTPTYNPPPVLRWNLDKGYLADLAAAGVRVPRTIFVPAGDRRSLGAVIEQEGLDEVVVKPRVSLSAVDTFRSARATAARDEARWAALVARRDVLVQPFLPAVQTEGERSIVLLGGRFAHAVDKTPRAGDFRVQSDHGGTRRRVEPSEGEVALAMRIAALAPGPLLYARVDLVRDGDGWSLMELEAIDPELYLGLVPGAAERFAEVIAGAMDG
jgi:glutathione synthase/RimK-type ligase-like ATP-grasp enzyme